MTISGTTELYFTIGDPVAQVRAPEVFNAVFQAHGIDAVVVSVRVAPAQLAAFVKATLASPTVKGFFVSIPHKAAFLALADQATPAAGVAGATNAIRRGANGGIEADLFDGEGFVRALAHFGTAVRGRKALVLGAGGAARAIGASLAGTGAAAVDFFDPAPGRADAVAGSLAQHFGLRSCALPIPDPRGYQLVINATPAGLQAEDPLPVNVDALDADATLVDIIMTPRPTRLVRLARQQGIRAFPGYEMLVQQVPLYLRFFGYEGLGRKMESELSTIRQILAPRGEDESS